jgi:hypothetical protein
MLVGARDFALFQVSWTSSGAHSAFQSVGVAGTAADHSPASSVEFNDDWYYTCIPSVCLHGMYKNLTFLLMVHTKLEACTAYCCISSGYLETLQWTVDIRLVYNGSVFIAFSVYKWTLYMRLTKGLCTVYILSQGYPWDIWLSMQNFWSFISFFFSFYYFLHWILTDIEQVTDTEYTIYT